MKPLAAGSLRTLVRIQLHDETAAARRSDGSVIFTPATIRKAWAEVRPMTGREYMEGQAVQSRVTHRVVIRWQKDVNHSCRILWFDRSGRERILGIVAVLDSEEMGVHMVLMCEELKSGEGS